MVIVSAFMSKFHVKLSNRAKNMKGNNEAMFDAMYADREKLETIFRFFDTDGNGSISREEFHRVRYCRFSEDVVVAVMVMTK